MSLFNGPVERITAGRCGGRSVPATTQLDATTSGSWLLPQPVFDGHRIPSISTWECQGMVA